MLPSTPWSSKWSLSFRFSYQNPVYASPLLLPGLVTRKIFVEEYRSSGSSLCSLLHCIVSSSLLGPYTVSSSAPHSRTPSLYVAPSVWITKPHTHKK
jgi:hypothetical protein